MIQIIESADNKYLKLAAALKERKYRRRENLFRAEGIRLAEMALAAGQKVAYGFFTPKCQENLRGAALLKKLTAQDIPIYALNENLYRKISDTQTPQGLLLLLRPKALPLKKGCDSPAPFYVALDGLKDPGNVGAVIRSADAAGCSGVIALKDTADLFSDKVVRSSMGSLFNLPLWQDIERAELLDFARRESLTLWAAESSQAGKSCYEADFTAPSLLVLGSEAVGLSPETDGKAQKIHIPMYGRAESLNVATAAGILLFEAARQRHNLGG